MSSPTDVPVRDGTIRLGQFLKLANLVETLLQPRPAQRPRSAAFVRDELKRLQRRLRPE